MMASGIETIDLGTVTDWASGNSGHDFSDAISLVVTLSTTSIDDPHPPVLDGYPTAGVLLTWGLYDSMGGEESWTMEDTSGLYSGWLGFDKSKRGDWGSPLLHSTRRFVVPFRPTLSVSGKLERPTRKGDEKLEATLKGVKAEIYWQGID